MNKKFFLAKVCDNQDPDNLNRVKITFTDKEEVVSNWIPIITSTAGNDSGFYSIPDVEEQVLVVSLDDANTNFCVLGSIWSNNIKPPATNENSDADFNKDGNNSLHFIKSRSGNMIILDDTDSKEKIQLIASEGKSKIEFSKADELINLESETDIKINAKSNLEITAEELDMNCSKQINISTEEFQTKSSKELNINSDKDISIKGSGIALN